MMDSNAGATSVSSWFDKACSLDLKGRCELLWSDKNPFRDTIVKVKYQNDPERRFNAHKLILAMGSRKLASELYDGSSAKPVMSTVCKSPIIVDIQTVSPAIMELALEFMYTDTIQKDLEWPEVGGLLQAAKELGMPRLAEFCENLFQEGLNCEQVLNLFMSLTSEDCDSEWPKEYYMELLKLCYRYILRNGDVILCARTFVEMSFEDIESFVGSDFLACDELTLFNALKRWSKHQCKMQGLDFRSIENCRKLLRISGDEDLGLLGYVRFPLIDSKTFTLQVHKSSRSLIPDEVAETVYEYYTLSEPQNIFSEKRRYTEVEIDENLVDYEEEVGRLCGLFNSRIINADKQSNPDSSKKDNPKMPAVSQPLVTNDKLPSSNQSEETEKTQEALVSIKTEPSFEDENSIHTQSVETKPDIQGRSPLKASNHGSPTVVRGSGVTTIKRRAKLGAKEEAMVPMKVKKVDSEIAELTPIKSSQIRLKSSISMDSSKSDVFSIKNQKIKYTKIVEECAKRPDVTKVIMDNVEIEKVVKIGKGKPLPLICLPKVTDFKLQAVVGKDDRSNLIENIQKINVEELIFFYRGDERFGLRLTDLYVNNVNASISFDGVTVLDIKYPGFTINCTKQLSLLKLNSQLLPNIKCINLGNCTIDMKNWLNSYYMEQVLELRLLCVKGLLNGQVLQTCPSLETVSLWAADNQTLTPTLCLDSLKSDNLRSLNVHGHMIKFNPSSVRQFVNVDELFFIDCSWDPSFVAFFPKMFPKLRKLCIVNKFSSPGPLMLSAFMTLGSIEEIVLWNFDMKTLNRSSEFKKLKKFIADLNFKNLTNSEFSFCIKRGGYKGWRWRGDSISRDDLTERIYKSFGFEHFYTFQAWSKYFWVNYDYY